MKAKVMVSVPLYRLEQWCRHYRRIAGNARPRDSRDSRTADAMRLAAGDLRVMESYLEYGRKKKEEG